MAYVICVSHGPARRSLYPWKADAVVTLMLLTEVGCLLADGGGDPTEDLGLGLLVPLGGTTFVRCKTDVGSGAVQPHTHDPSARGCMVPIIWRRLRERKSFHGKAWIWEGPYTWRRPCMLLGQCAHGETICGTTCREEPNNFISHFDIDNFRLDKIFLDQTFALCTNLTCYQTYPYAYACALLGSR